MGNVGYYPVIMRVPSSALDQYVFAPNLDNGPLTISARPDKPLTPIDRCALAVDRRTSQERLATRNFIHPKCKRLPRTLQSMPSFPKSNDQGRSTAHLILCQVDKKQKPTFILCDTDLTRHTAGGANAYLQYVRHVTNTASPSPNTPATPGFNPPSYMGKVPDAAVEFTQGYADFLQAPLQPLMDDLGSMTYEVFERDPVKYNQYEEVRCTVSG